MVQGQAGALVEAPKPGDGREQTSQARVAGEGRRAQAEARTQAKAARTQTEADLAEAKVKVAKEQDAAIARALQEDDEARRQADLKEVAEKEAEAVPDWHPHRRLLHQGLQPAARPADRRESAPGAAGPPSRAGSHHPPRQ
jgi:hypothetical protein